MVWTRTGWRQVGQYGLGLSGKNGLCDALRVVGAVWAHPVGGLPRPLIPAFGQRAGGGCQLVAGGGVGPPLGIGPRIGDFWYATGNLDMFHIFEY
jgi:hypothetical protein